MPTLLITALSTLAAVSAAGVAWLIARRTSSGRVDTTEAATLWAESKQMRSELRDEITVLRAGLAEMQSELAALRTETAECRAESASLRKEIMSLRKRLGAKADR
jgi:predicted nuclease with TOPRIM domain